MVSMKERVWDKSALIEEERQKVLNFITEEKAVTLEMIIHRFSWLRWGDLFSIVGGFRKEGLVTIHQIGSQMGVRVKGHSENAK